MVRSYGLSIVLSVLLALLAGACSIDMQQGEQDKPDGAVVTATLAPSLTPRPSVTPAPPTFTPTVAPVSGLTTTRVNVRSGPNTASQTIAILNTGESVQIVGRDASGSWFQVLHPAGQDGLGWVTAAYISTQGQPDVPVIGAVGAGSAGASGVVTQKINVRSGPGTGFNSLGTLDAQDVVALTGKNATGTWLQIAFEGGPDGKGWISAAFVRAGGVEDLPIVSETGALLGTGTPTDIPPTPTPTIVPAPNDNDSAESPAIAVTLSVSGARLFSYSSDVSSPQGDPEDWVQFSAQIPQDSGPVTLYLSLACLGNGALEVELWQGGGPLSGWGSLVCGDNERPLAVTSGQTYLLRLSAALSTSELRYVTYTLTVKAVP
jgi:uncharacterized protein YraI